MRRKLCDVFKWVARRTPLMTHFVSRRSSPQRLSWVEECVFVYFLVFVCLCYLSPALNNIFRTLDWLSEYSIRIFHQSNCLAKAQFTHQKVLFTHKLWPTPLPTNTVTPSRLYTSLPAPMYIYAHCLFIMLFFYLLFQLHIICYPALGSQGCY